MSDETQSVLVKNVPIADVELVKRTDGNVSELLRNALHERAEQIRSIDRRAARRAAIEYHLANPVGPEISTDEILAALRADRDATERL